MAGQGKSGHGVSLIRFIGPWAAGFWSIGVLVCWAIGLFAFSVSWLLGSIPTIVVVVVGILGVIGGVFGVVFSLAGGEEEQLHNFGSFRAFSHDGDKGRSSSSSTSSMVGPFSCPI